MEKHLYTEPGRRLNVCKYKQRVKDMAKGHKVGGAEGVGGGRGGGRGTLLVTALSGTYANVLALCQCSPQVPTPLHCYTCHPHHECVCFSAGYNMGMME